ncbi:tRNA (guanine-N(7)-)-methyltransferase B [Frankliniella fusca]|uniref:tRNA (Guanine-N(7)-)-methyltransferase B n=1 Tax=Frankliniella fusca TaxID=407009 RepID=A0AAE1L9J5_9NEOP|nr:tRNA (guanine-N(7)-)-methyltransferase B [Frankliniella fusca]
MSKHSRYANVNKIKKKIKRDVVKSLQDDSESWIANSDSNHAASTAASEPGYFKSLANEVCSNNLSISGSDSLSDEEKPSPASGLNTAESLVLDNSSSHCDNFENESDCIWNLSFLEEPHAFNDSFSGPSTFQMETESLDHVITLHFDCDTCINCICGVCDDCVHIEGDSCRHCDYCRSGIDSDAGSDSDHFESDEDIESFDVDPEEELSEDQKANTKIKNEFTEIVLEQGASHALIKKMLTFFRKNNFGDFPKCPSTLLKTPVVTKVRSVPPGEYWHRGLEADLLMYAKTSGCEIIRVNFSVDGVPMMASTGADFYPICCTFNDSKDVVIDGVYYGVGKPNSADEFLKEFVDEMNLFVENGLECEGRHVCIEIHKCICDAVAKSWLLNVKGHSGTLPKHLYEHFLVLSVAMTVLSSEEHIQLHLDYARELIIYFIKTFMEVYGKKYTSHNIHNLVHLVDDCKVHGTVDKFSAFPFENFYQKLKKMIRKGDKPLQQLCRRYEEQKLKNPVFMKTAPVCVGFEYSGLHNDGPLPPWCSNPQFSRMHAWLGHKLSLTQANNCCRLIDGSKYVLVDFPEGPSIVQGCWITEDMKYSAWPPEANYLSGLAYDKFMQLAQYEPKDGWTIHPITRIRAFADDFSKIRLKVKRAEDCSDTDLNSGAEMQNKSGRSLRSRKSRSVGSTAHGESSGDDESTLQEKTKVSLPIAPNFSQTLGSYIRKNEDSRSSSSHHHSRRDSHTSSKSSSSKHSNDEKASMVPPTFGFDLKRKEEDQGGSIQRKSPNDTRSTPKTSTSQSYLEAAGELSMMSTEPHKSSESNGTEVSNERKGGNKGDSCKPEASLKRSTSPSKRNHKVPVNRAWDLVDNETSNADEKDCNANEIKTPKSESLMKRDHSKEPSLSKSTPELNTPKQAAIAMAKKLTDDGYVILNFTEMRSQYKQILAEVSKLSLRPKGEAPSENTTAKLDASFQQPEEEDVLFGLPAVDSDAWDRFNQKLKDDSKFATVVVGKLKDLADGESDLGDYIRAILQRVITNSLASEYGWEGRLGNKQFSNLFIVKVIKWMVKKYTKFPRVKDDVKAVTAQWLRLAPQRSGGKNFKKYTSNKKNPNTEVSEESNDQGACRPKRVNTTSTPRNAKKKPSFSVVASPIRSPAKKKAKVVRATVDSDSDLDDHMTNTFWCYGHWKIPNGFLGARRKYCNTGKGEVGSEGKISVKTEKTERIVKRSLNFDPPNHDLSSESLVIMSEEDKTGDSNVEDGDSEKDEAEADKSATSDMF